MISEFTLAMNIKVVVLQIDICEIRLPNQWMLLSVTWPSVCMERETENADFFFSTKAIR